MTCDMLALKKLIYQTLERRSDLKVIFAQTINDPRLSNWIIRTLKKLNCCLTRSLGL
jgi:hypothetical protein